MPQQLVKLQCRLEWPPSFWLILFSSLFFYFLLFYLFYYHWSFWEIIGLSYSNTIPNIPNLTKQPNHPSHFSLPILTKFPVYRNIPQSYFWLNSYEHTIGCNRLPYWDIPSKPTSLLRHPIKTDFRIGTNHLLFSQMLMHPCHHLPITYKLAYITTSTLPVTWLISRPIVTHTHALFLDYCRPTHFSLTHSSLPHSLWLSSQLIFYLL